MNNNITTVNILDQPVPEINVLILKPTKVKPKAEITFKPKLFLKIFLKNHLCSAGDY